MCATNRPYACLRQSEVLHFALLNQFFHRTGYFLNRHTWINAVLIKKVNHIGPEPFQRCIGHLFDVLGPAVQAHPLRASIRVELEPELGGDDDPAAERSEGLAHQILVRERTVHLGGVEERHATLHGDPQERDHLRPVPRRTVREAHPHAPEPESRHLEVAASQRALLHFSSR